MAISASAVSTESSGELSARHRTVIVASSLGTVFEWYDFYLYGTLALFFGSVFFPPGNDVAAGLATLATFGAGFGVRPFGAIVFGRIGDIVGRKYTFLITIVVMGLSTALVGVLPTYAQVGILAPILLVALRLAQGLALGGEYGGAATYVAEHAPNVPGSIIARQVLTPLDLERTYGLTEGNIFHGDLNLEQLFFNRPVAGWSQYRTPINGLYLCGAGAHPGGGVTGAPGHNAAHQVLRDWKRGKLKATA